jgi:hypothetical protein
VGNEIGTYKGGCNVREADVGVIVGNNINTHGAEG